MNLFGKKKKDITINSNQIINNLQDTVNTLDKRDAFLEKQIFELKNHAKKAVKEKKKSQALYCIKKSKILEKQQSNILNTKLNIELQILALTQAISNSNTFESVKAGQNVLSEYEKKLDVDKVADVMDNIEENLANMECITETISRPLGQYEMDDETILAELEAEIMNEEVLSKPITLPSVPSTCLKTSPKKTSSNKTPPKKSEEDEIRELEALMT
jgi:Snf7